MRSAVLVLVLAGLAGADDLYPRQGNTPLAEGVMVVDSSGDKVVYLDKMLKQRSLPKDVVGRIDEKRTAIHEFVERSDAATTADGVLALIDFAEAENFHKSIFPDLYRRVLSLDPDNERANVALGNVSYEGEWMTPEERDRRIAAAEEEAMRAKGMVQYEGQWVTPEDKEKLEQGLRKYEGRWMTEDQIKEAQGYVKYEGKWVKKDELAILQVIGPAREDTGLGDALQIAQTEHYAVMGDLAAAEMQTLADTMEKLFVEWTRLFPADRDSRILEGKHRVFVFRKARPYQLLVRARYERQKATEHWSENFARTEEERMKMRLRETSFWDVQPYVVSGHVQMPDPFEALKAHCVHFGANALVTRHARTRFPTWWLNEGIAYWFEKRITGTIQTFNGDVGAAGGYANQNPLDTNKANPWLDATRWEDLLVALIREGRDPPLDRMKSKVLFGSENRLGAQDLAKAWSLVSFLIQDDPEKFAAFLDECKGGSGSEVEREAAAVILHYGSYDKIEQGWRAWALNGFRAVR